MTEAQRGTPNLADQLIKGLHAMAMKADNKNGTMMTLAAFMPASTITMHAMTIRAFAVGDLMSI